MFLQHLFSKGTSGPSLAQAAAALGYEASLSDRALPGQHKVVQTLVNHARRLAPPVSHKQPATLEHLIYLSQRADSLGSFVASRTFVLSLTLFTSCSRFDDLANLTRSSAEFFPTFYRLDLKKTKTNQFRKDDEKFGPRGNSSSICPLRNLQSWMLRKDVLLQSEAPLFPKRPRSDECISYTCYFDNLKAALKKSGLPRITPHCHRTGFSTEAVRRGVSLDSLQLCGLWKSQESLHSYVLKDPETRLQAAKKIGF